ncbi:MAG: hypothetical protein B6244_13570 [Candidatus Cloacimonetes bacterium 4572_55]|nr:MAG: hypothetical protein B6244_13570 [Candidatus Cloacimonetes bacterium 4572_55]
MKYLSILICFLFLYGSEIVFAVPVQLIYRNSEAETVFVTGNFNGWNSSSRPMFSGESDSLSILLNLSPGRYLYKFIVDTVWIPDPLNPNREPDGYGGFNSVLYVEKPLPEIKTISLIGDLTNPSVQDPENLMQKVGDSKWIKTTHLAPGSYRFTLALNKNRNLIFGGRIDRSLRVFSYERRERLILRVSKASAYTFCFDSDSRKLGIKKTMPIESIAAVSGPDSWDINLPFTLSAEKSLPLPRSSFIEYRWQPENQEARNLLSDLENQSVTPIQSSRITLKATRPGMYRFRLHALDSVRPVERTHTVHIFPSVQLLSDFTSSDPASRAGNMKPIRDGGNRPSQYEWIHKADRDGNVSVQFVLDHDTDRIYGDSHSGDTSFSDGLQGSAKLAPENDPITFPVRNGHFYRILFDREKLRYEANEAQMVEFRYDPKSNSRKSPEIWTVDIVGDWNDWQGEKTPMERTNSGVYRAYVQLDEGLYRYKIRVNGDIWLEDMNADPGLRTDDLTGQGTYNSGIIVGETGDLYGTPEPAHIQTGAIRVTANVMGQGDVEATIRVLSNDVASVNLHYFSSNRSGANKQSIPLEKISARLGFDYYRGLFHYAPDDSLIRYCFELIDGKAVLFWGRNAAGEHLLDSTHYFSVAPKVRVVVPEWARHAVWYAILPDRFRNGQKKNDPTMNEMGSEWFNSYLQTPFTLSEWVEDWETLQPWELAYKENASDNSRDHARYFRHYGGDFKGVSKKLSYLTDLGITAIWFNPVTYSESNHKYDAASYHHIDPHFGDIKDFEYLKNNASFDDQDPSTWIWTKSDKLFLKFVNKAHKKGIRVIIDGVFNHTGNEFWAFERAVQEGPESPYADWYHFTDWSGYDPDSSLAYNKEHVQYECWWNYSSLPNLNTHNPKVREHIFHVTRRWLDPDGNPKTDDGIDGFRLDAPNEVEPEFWEEWRRVVNATKSDVYMTGELWDESPDWVQGNRFTALMNYPWLQTSLRFFRDKKNRISVSEFEAELQRLRVLYPIQVTQCVQNLTGSHDMDRLLSSFINPDRELDKDNRAGDGYDARPPCQIDPGVRDKVKLFYLFQMTYVGAPMIYYGDEVGMYGADDPDCRKPMLWDDLKYENGDRPDVNLREFVKNLIAIRKSSKAFSIGTFEPILIDDARDIFGYQRSHGTDSFWVILNNGDRAQTIELPVDPDMTLIKDLLHDREYPVADGKIQLALEPKTGTILSIN